MHEPAAEAPVPDVLAWPWPEARRVLEAEGWRVSVRRAAWGGAVHVGPGDAHAVGGDRVVALRVGGPRRVEAVVARFSGAVAPEGAADSVSAGSRGEAGPQPTCAPACGPKAGAAQ